MEQLSDEQVQIILDHNAKVELVFDQIDKLYSKIMEGFYRGNYAVYNPLIFSKLTIGQFIDWIIENNDTVSKLLRN
jgi:hypothetical protein